MRQALDEAFVRRVVMGLAMGATAIALIYSPLGVRSGEADGQTLYPAARDRLYRMRMLTGGRPRNAT